MTLHSEDACVSRQESARTRQGGIPALICWLIRTLSWRYFMSNAARLGQKADRASSTMLISAIALALLPAMPLAIAAELHVRVVGVNDGDTITVIDNSRNQYKVRLAGIDAPEKRQPFGDRSKQALSSLVFDRQVLIDLGKTDRYGRIVSKVVVNNIDANLEQVVSGMAWHYKKYQREQSPKDRAAYARAEEAARAAERGLWQDRYAIPPWDFRKSAKGK